MPEFCLDYGTAEAAKVFHSLDSFTQGYVTAMFWTDASSADDGDLADATFAELAPEALEAIKADCADFQQRNAEMLERGYILGEAQFHFHAERAGADFWLTRNRHGAGFWDRGLGEVGKALTDAAHVYGSVSLYCGDDGRIYVQ